MNIAKFLRAAFSFPAWEKYDESNNAQNSLKNFLYRQQCSEFSSIRIKTAWKNFRR